MDDKVRKINIVITKYYLLAWLYGLTGIGCIYYNHWIIGSIMLFFFLAYSVADYQNPPKPPDENNGDNNDPTKPA